MNSRYSIPAPLTAKQAYVMVGNFFCIPISRASQTFRCDKLNRKVTMFLSPRGLSSLAVDPMNSCLIFWFRMAARTPLLLPCAFLFLFLFVELLTTTTATSIVVHGGHPGAQIKCGKKRRDFYHSCAVQVRRYTKSKTLRSVLNST